MHTFRHLEGNNALSSNRGHSVCKDPLGHRCINNTLIYIQLAKAISKRLSDNSVCKMAKAADDAQKLIEADFDYVCEVEGFELFHKRKCG